MSIEFDEDKMPTSFNGMGSMSGEGKSGSKMIDWIIKKGLANNVASANIILIISTVFIFGISIYFFKFGFSLPNFDEPVPATSRDVLPSGLDPAQGVENNY